MSTTVEIPGGTATFKDPVIITKRQERALQRAWAALGPIAPKLAKAAREMATDDGRPLAEIADDLPEMTGADLDLIFQLQDLTIVTFLDSWTLPRDLPTVETVGELPRNLYDALGAATKVMGDQTMDFSPNPDQSTPTGPSSP